VYGPGLIPIHLSKADMFRLLQQLDWQKYDLQAGTEFSEKGNVHIHINWIV